MARIHDDRRRLLSGAWLNCLEAKVRPLPVTDDEGGKEVALLSSATIAKINRPEKSSNDWFDKFVGNDPRHNGPSLLLQRRRDVFVGWSAARQSGDSHRRNDGIRARIADARNPKLATMMHKAITQWDGLIAVPRWASRHAFTYESWSIGMGFAMPYFVAPDEVEDVVRGLLGSTDVDGGATDEQLEVLWSVTSHLWKRPDLRDAGLSAISASETAARVTDERARRRFHLIMVTLELCRHPLTSAQVARAEEFAEALDIGGADLLIMRDWIAEGVASAIDDWKRCFGSHVMTNSEISLRSSIPGEQDPWVPQVIDPILAERLQELHGLPEGSLGHSFLEFYRRNGIDLPGSTDATLMAAVAVSHDCLLYTSPSPRD